MGIKTLFIAAALLALSIIEQTNSTNFDKSSSSNSTSSVNGNLRSSSMTCNIYPRVCTVAGSEGPDCCKKKCVNIETDGLNCGRCGRRCRYGEICCSGSCVNILQDSDNCGWCDNKCKNGDECRHGMCDYA